MLMFTETEVLQLRTLSKVSRQTLVWIGRFTTLFSVNWSWKTSKLTTIPTLRPVTSVYIIPHRSCRPFSNPQLTIFASQVCFPRSFLFFNQLTNAIGEYPLLRRKFPDHGSALDIIEKLLSHADVSLELEDSLIRSTSAHSLTLVYIIVQH
jgi:hypothetical protein